MSLDDLNPAVDERFQRIRAENSRGIFASAGPRYKGAVFGRDSLEVAEDLIVFDPVIPREVLLTLASLQGLRRNENTEEEPGKIHHEYRSLSDVGDDSSQSIYSQLEKIWGDGEGKDAIIYYGSADATPLFARLGAQYVREYGDDILREPVTGRDGRTRSLADHLLMAKDWLLVKLNQSDINLVEFLRTNPLGEKVQTWKDSVAGNLHADGSVINYDDFIAPLEVQGYTYDALKGMEELFPGSVPVGTVKQLGGRIVEHFWLKEEQMFAQALDRDELGIPRAVKTPTSSSGLLLDSDVLLDMQDTDAMVQATVDMLLGKDFLTSAGIRCRSFKYRSLVDYPDYHGSYAVWFKETNDFIKGLEKHHRQEQAKKLAQALVSTIQELGEYYEYVFVDDKGKVQHPEWLSGMFIEPRVSAPEPAQGWTISAFVRCLRIIQE